MRKTAMVRSADGTIVAYMRADGTVAIHHEHQWEAEELTEACKRGAGSMERNGEPATNEDD